VLLRASLLIVSRSLPLSGLHELCSDDAAIENAGAGHDGESSKTVTASISVQAGSR